ncbi:hypothetical protein ACFV3R_06000 [Streptomyces sp. NPDC059740]|uniref:hypothetical protein n=1 Tax=Streptomyces sp. NPDC059740 TaxID=3346926 RepID=UPI003657962F
MTSASHDEAPPTAEGRSTLQQPPHRGRWQRLAGPAGAAVLLLPSALAALAATVFGSRGAACRLLRAGADGRPLPGRVRLAAQAVLAGLLGVLALVLAALLGLLVARGLLYGWVDRGPYDTSWGGPTRTGAWLTHFAVSLPFGAADVALLHLLAALQRRLTAPLRGARRAWWVVPAVGVLAVAGAVFVVAFVHQA